MSAYRNDLSESPDALTREEQLELFRKYQSGDVDSRNRLVCSVLPLIFGVCSSAQTRFPDGLELDDVVSMANLEFLERLDSYDPDKSSISTFANACAWRAIENHGIRRELRHATRCVRIDDHPEVQQIEDDRQPYDFAESIGDEPFLEDADLQLLADIKGGKPRGVIGVCQKHNLTWRQLFAYMDQIDNRLQEGATARSLLAS